MSARNGKKILTENG